jgi:hypothetical protein
VITEQEEAVVARQRLDKYVSASTNQLSTIRKVLKAVYSLRPPTEEVTGGKLPAVK